MIKLHSKIYLASTSTRRKLLLEQLIGENFQILEPNYEEEIIERANPHDLAKDSALGKAQSVLNQIEDGLILSADTVVSHNNKIMGKPHTAERAEAYLSTISGQVVEVITGVAIISKPSLRVTTDVVTTRVFISKITQQEIRDYIATKEPLDKAGGFAIQGLGAIFVTKIEGDFYNVVGLPLQRLYTMLIVTNQ